MNDVNAEIGARIRGIRELNELSVGELALRINCGAEVLSGYESGERDIPVSILHHVSSELGVSMTSLLTGEEAKLSVYSVVRKDRGADVSRRADYNYKALASNFAGRALDPYLITIPARSPDEEISLNSHGGQEFHYCLEGSFMLKIDRHTVTVDEGDCVYFDSQYPHGMRACGNAPAKELVIILGTGV